MLHVPQANTTIDVTTRQKTAVYAPSYRIDQSWVWQCLSFLATVRMPQSHHGIIAAAGQEKTVRRECNAVNMAHMPA
jgi:hypothetical protein